jgi:hypothetical protein
MHQVSPVLYERAAESTFLQCEAQPVNETRLIVPALVTSTTVQNSVEMVLPTIDSSPTVVTYDQVQQNLPRYQLLEKKSTKEVYWDHRIGQQVIVKRENN